MTKYAAAALMVLALAGVIWAGVSYTRSMGRVVQPVAVAQSKDPQAKASEDAMRHVRALDQMLTQIDDATRALPSTVAMAPLAASPKLASNGAPTLAQSKVARGPVISLVYLSPSFQRVVIDGTMLAVGDTLPGAGRITAIGANEITLVRGSERYTLAVPKGPALGSVSTPVPVKAAVR